MPKSKRHSVKPWFSEHTSEAIVLELRTQLNIWCITGWVQNHAAKQLNDSLTKFKTQNFRTTGFEIKVAQPNQLFHEKFGRVQKHIGKTIKRYCHNASIQKSLKKPVFTKRTSEIVFFSTPNIDVCGRVQKLQNDSNSNWIKLKWYWFWEIPKSIGSTYTLLL